jgi:hypothetical protein
MVTNTGNRDHQYSIRLHGVELMKGDTRSLADVFNNLEGRNFEPMGAQEQAREQWLASMSAELKTPLAFGERIVMATPEDHVLRESLVGRFIPVDGRPKPEQVHRPRC